uniref:SGF29 C-terminal domain-containing protein n=1 Tax=Chrysotila carterae TaxID=13221 RepID=A0A7S4BC18_CHRCT|mmetsp:Transcript_2723/g.5796  ORF Transcript_2723/g.5796 Transcript_2723/m.5796 type:complete len:478 (+) Transcript_2723:369-1802(+)
MPRKSVSLTDLKAEEETASSYLDNFLTSVTETTNLPGEIKRQLSQLRDLDTHAQELFERMQKLSKSHITRAKRNVQDQKPPEEELLVKARRVQGELLEVGAEKVKLAELSYATICHHLERCESELQKFEEELREKGQLKAPPSGKTSLSIAIAESPSLAATSVLCTAPHTHISSASALPTNLPHPSLQFNASPRSHQPLHSNAPAHSSSFALHTARAATQLEPPLSSARRARPPPPLATPEPAPAAPATAHKRARGRKASNKEAERLRVAAEDKAAANVYGVIGGTYPGIGAVRHEYPDSVLPLASRADSHRALCGAVPPAPNYQIPERAKVMARTSQKVSMDDWILAMVLRYNAASNKYVVLDVDASDEVDRNLAGASSRQHTLSSKLVHPLPLTEPSVYTSYNEYQQGQLVLALYPDTTCFYRAYVNTPPSQCPLNSQQRRDYLIEFEDENEASGRSEPMRVPQKYVLRLPGSAA